MKFRMKLNLIIKYNNEVSNETESNNQITKSNKLSMKFRMKLNLIIKQLINEVSNETESNNQIVNQ